MIDMVELKITASNVYGVFHKDGRINQSPKKIKSNRVFTIRIEKGCIGDDISAIARLGKDVNDFIKQVANERP